jgi:hypothetical protein
LDDFDEIGEEKIIQRQKVVFWNFDFVWPGK